MSWEDLIRGFVREKKVTHLFVALVIAEAILLNQAPVPWSGLCPVLIPGNAMGLIVGVGIRRVRLASKPQPRDVWVVNGEGTPRTDTAKAKSLAALTSWEAGDRGRFFVQRNNGVFEAVGTPATGFIVHCTPASEDEAEYACWEAITGRRSSRSGCCPAPHVPRKGSSQIWTAPMRRCWASFIAAAPTPRLPWTSGEDVRTNRFGHTTH